jgi:YD repeat-containing protein
MRLNMNTTTEALQACSVTRKETRRLGYNGEDLVSVSGAYEGEENKNTLEYMLGHLTKVSAGGTDYTFSYDGWGRQKEIKIAGQAYQLNHRMIHA